MFHPIDKDDKLFSIACDIEVLNAQVERDCLQTILVKPPLLNGIKCSSITYYDICLDCRDCANVELQINYTITSLISHICQQSACDSKEV